MTTPTKRTARWTVKDHLLAVVVAVVLVFVVLGALVAHLTLQSATRSAERDAADLVAVASAELADTVALTDDQVQALAQNPTASVVVDRPEACTLSFALDLMPGARMDVVAPDGTVLCSSRRDLPPGAGHGGAAWLTDLEAGLTTVSPPLTDGVTGELAVVTAQPILDASGTEVGAIAAVSPTGGIGDRLTALYGGEGRHQFAVVDEGSGQLLSLSSDAADAAEAAGEAPEPLRAGGYLTAAEPVEGTAWTAVAAIDHDVALGPTRSVLVRGALVTLAALLVLLGGLWAIDRRIARPLRRLAAVVGDTGPHVPEVLGSIGGPTEVVSLAEEFRDAVAAHERFQSQLAHQALHDPLTGLPNRALLGERLTHSLEQRRRAGGGVAVLFLDLDRFKLVNDSLGHAVGDQVLIATAGRVAGELRPGDTLARFGGDEFVVVGEGFEDPREAERLAERLLTAVAAPVQAHDMVVRVTASVGIALSTAETETGGDLIRDADTAMYLAKDRGGAGHQVFDEGLRDRVTARLTMESEFRVALERGELHLEYQPRVDLVSEEVVGVEALLRWEHPALGSVPPATFIPVAEETGLIVPVGHFVLEQACRQAAAWEAGGLDVTVAVNLSGRQLADAALTAEVAQILDGTGLAPHRLCLELTESVLMNDTSRAALALGDLHRLGVQLSIDDFGTGYSSLAYLHRFPVDELKIDRDFVRGLPHQHEQRTLVTAIVAMARALDLRVVAEGVESEEQADELRALGCHFAQGYLFAAPQPVEAVTELLAGRRIGVGVGAAVGSDGGAAPTS